MTRAFVLAAFMLLAQSHAAGAMVLSCFPLRAEGAVKIDAYVDAFAQGEYPPKTLEAVRVLVRFGEDPYEYHPEHTKESTIRDGVLRLHLFQALSAGATAELRFEGKIAANKGEQFTMRMQIRGEQRVGQGQVRCTIE
jgi:hypothetical protein